MKIYVAAVEALRRKERGDETQFPTKIGGKTRSQQLRFVKFHSQLRYAFDALFCRNWQFSPPNSLTSI